MLVRAILPQWAAEQFPTLPRVVEKDLNDLEIKQLNEQLYNIYYLPNYPSILPDKTVDGTHIDKFEYVFVDMDLKEGKFSTKDEFIASLSDFLLPTKIVDSGNGVHVYWKVIDLDAMSFLRLQRRLCRKLQTDEAVCKIYQLMRLPGTVNTKKPDDLKVCETIFESEVTYCCEQLDKALPQITLTDEEYCKKHYDKTYNLGQQVQIDDKIPLKFSKLLRESPEVKEIWSRKTDDRSKSDYRLGHIMFANGFSRDEALSVLVNTDKALERAPAHRVSYAQNIVDKIWTFELSADKEALGLSSTVREILQKSGDNIKGTRFPCWSYIDATEHGFRLGQVIGLVAGSGVGKTAMALNMFKGFVANNPDYEHFFVPLEQPAHEIADRWKTMCSDESPSLYDKVHVLSNYAENGSYRNLSFKEIKEYILRFQQVTGKKVGSVVIDHIGALKKSNKDGRQSIEDICHEMKAFAVETNTMLIMQSQAPREKAGIGDLELNKDAAYGTVFFESYCDYLITIWQPLKRMYSEPKCPSVTAFKFCKIRHKKKGVDNIVEDTCYRLYFDPKTEHLRELSQHEEVQFDFFNKQAINKRKADRKTEIIEYKSMPWTKGDSNGAA